MQKWFTLLFLFLSLLANGQKIDSLLQVLKTAKPDTQKVNLLNSLGYVYWITGNDSLAILQTNHALQLAKQLKFIPGEAQARFQLTRIELDRFTAVESAYLQLDTLLLISQRTKDKEMEGRIYLRRAQFYYDVVTRQSQVKPLLQKALRLFEEIDNKALQGTVYNELSQAEGRNGNFAQSIPLMLKARKLQESVNDKKGLRSTLPNLGGQYSAMGLFSEAIKIFKEVEIVAKSTGDSTLMSFIYNQRAEILDKQGKYQDAIKELKKAEKIYETTQAPYWLARTYARMGKEYVQLNDYENSLKYTNKADQLFAQAASAETLDHYVCQNYGKIYLHQKDYQKVIKNAQKGLQWAHESNPPLLMESTEYNRQLSIAYEALNQPQLALKHHKLYKAQSDSILNRETIQRVTAAALTYNFEKEQQGNKLKIEVLEKDKLALSRNILIALLLLGSIITLLIVWSNKRLRQKNKELLYKNQEIEEALFKGQTMERKRVASELHDNLNSKLAALRWRLEAIDTSKMPPDYQKRLKGSLEMLEDIYDDVRFISHSMIPVELETVGIIPVLQKLLDQLNANSKTQFQLDAPHYKPGAPSKLEHQFYMIILELINNVLKHAHASLALIRLSRQDSSIFISVSDNGLGISPDDVSTGMGMQNLTNRVGILGGTLQIKSSAINGTEVNIIVPVT